MATKTIYVDPGWGMWGEQPPCEHLTALREFLEQHKLTVWSEHGEEPHGWVNVGCDVCRRTYETTLRPQEGGYDDPTVTWSNEDPEDADD